jgi:hypothetical protein
VWKGVEEMSIFIKGVEMPKNCRECFACKAELSQEKKVIYVCCFAMADCPLISVPEHGDLIDAQEQMRLMQSCEYDTYDDYIRAFNMLDNAPTIIPASEEGET